jgi:hypothetical protein
MQTCHEKGPKLKLLGRRGGTQDAQCFSTRSPESPTTVAQTAPVSDREAHDLLYYFS